VLSRVALRPSQARCGLWRTCGHVARHFAASFGATGGLSPSAGSGGRAGPHGAYPLPATRPDLNGYSQRLGGGVQRQGHDPFQFQGE
jgi:hypothetical protein